MKIESPKYTSIPRVAARPAPAPAAASNTGIVPTAKRPSDGFENKSLPRPGSATTGNTGITGVGKPAGKTSLNLDFKLDPALEPYREQFAKLGSRIAKLPTEEERTKAIDLSSIHLSKSLNQPLDKVKEGVINATKAALAYGPSAGRDPQCFRMDRMLDYSPTLKEAGAALKSLGLSISKDTSIKGRKAILEAAQSELAKLNLQGKDAKMAQKYIVGLVNEDRGNTSGATGGRGRLPRFNSDTFQFLQRRER